MITDRDAATMVALIRAGQSLPTIAKKYGITEKAVSDAVNNFVNQVLSPTVNSVNEMYAQFGILCQHYQMVGECLKTMSAGLSNSASIADMEKCVVEGDIKSTLLNISTSFIVLHPWQFVSPQEALEKAIKSN
jgi:predicted DNA-binding protein YlxM (UPF0122 family)